MPNAAALKGERLLALTLVDNVDEVGLRYAEITAAEALDAPRDVKPHHVAGERERRIADDGEGLRCDEHRLSSEPIAKISPKWRRDRRKYGRDGNETRGNGLMNVEVLRERR